MIWKNIYLNVLGDVWGKKHRINDASNNVNRPPLPNGPPNGPDGPPNDPDGPPNGPNSPSNGPDGRVN